MSEATQTELLERAKENAVMEVRVSMPARIVSFDSATRTATVEILMKMVAEDDSAIDYPPLVDCPCVFTRGGGFHVSHGYKQNDNGVVMFSDRCIDGWFESGQAAVPMDFRVHSMSDAYFIGAAANMTDVSPIIDGALFIGKDDNSAGLQINLDGSVIIKGTSFTIQPPTVANGVVSNGIALETHTHNGVQSGNSNTGLPQ